MSDEFNNPCECIWNPATIQRLLSLLRQAQAYCTDTECFSLSRLPGPQNNESMSEIFVLGIAFLTLVLLYLTRPNSLRDNSEIHSKLHNKTDANDDPPPPSPPSIY